ncbi:MAG: hypothetical protein IPL96_17525 [Holophagaceae bacterium]|nr:hypothetical protein [Holophagaceae bacterium]
MLLAFPALAPLLLIAPALLAQAPEAPTVEAILARHFEARGGLAKIRAIQSLTSTGRVEVGPMVLTLRIENPRRAFRSDTSLQGVTKTEAWDGRAGWILDPFAGVTAPQPMGPAQLRQAELQADFDGPLVDWRAKGHRITFAGMAIVNGAETYALQVSMKNGDALTSYLDAKTYMEVKAINAAVSGGRVVEVETLLGDYRSVAGVMLPFALDIRPKGQAEGLRIRFDRVEADLPVDAARFRSPGGTSRP